MAHLGTGLTGDHDLCADGVLDNADACPTEDAAGWDLDGNGCLDDTDGDGVTDDLDPCMGFDDWADADGDTVCNSDDTCRDDAVVRGTGEDLVDFDMDDFADDCDTCALDEPLSLTATATA